MAHIEQRNFCLKVKEKFPDFFKGKKVLDIGSLDINGSNRDLFENCNYLGLDVGEGKNVDIVSVGHLFDGPDNYFDTIISTEVFEHDMFYEETIKNIMRMLKPGGLFLFTCAAPGRPEHGTRRCGENCAPLLIQISEEWADYYKNLDENDIRKICGFNETFPDCYFEFKNKDIEIPADLYFYGIKGGEKYLTNDVIPQYQKKDFDEHIFVVDCWPDNENRENDLLECIKILKTFNIRILLVGHYPVKPEIQKMVDYYIFDKSNPLLLSDELSDYDVDSGRWTLLNGQRIENLQTFHHDYAIWETMRNAFNFCNYLGKKYIHFLEYDNIPNAYQYKQSFIERIKDFDAIIYEYDLDSANRNNLDVYCSTYIFSIRTDIAIKTINSIKNKFEFFHNKPNGWQLERQFLREMKKFTNNFHITKYIANDNELNTQSAWNRDGMIRNGTYFQSYLCADQDKNLYIHLIHGFYHKIPKDEYLIEVEYGDFKKFISLRKNEMRVDPIGKYQKGKRVKIYVNGVEVSNEYLSDDFDNFYKHNYITNENFPNKNVQSNRRININFIDGPFIEITDDVDLKYTVEFINSTNNEIVYSTTIHSNNWAKASLLYYVNWKIVVKGIDNEYYNEFTFDPKNRRILISFESSSLGDNIAWIPYISEFAKKHDCEIFCSTFHNEMFKDQYENINFINPGTIVNDIYTIFRIGLFKKGLDYDYNKHPYNPIKEPLMKICSDILGLEYKEIKPKLPKLGETKNKRVCIGIHSTSQCKYWNNPNGWQEVVDYLIEEGYEVRLLSKEIDGYMGNKNPIGVVQQPPSDLKTIIKVLQESEFFIGISSGLSWLAWASGIPIVLISGFTDVYLEPFDGVERIINKNVCNGCWHTHNFDPGNWNWCPIHQNTERQFECSKEISSEMVIEKITKLIGK